jgi:hypothetical protein
MSHYDMANLLGKRNRGLGVSVIAITSVIGNHSVPSMIATGCHSTRSRSPDRGSEAVY